MKKFSDIGVLVVLCGCLVGQGCVSMVRGRIRPLSKNAVPAVVAVSSFENKSGFVGEWELGDGMADLLISELVKTKNFVVVEREHLSSVEGEINRQKGKGFRAEGKVREGKLKNAEYLVRGVINDFSQISRGEAAVTGRKVGIGGKGCTARVDMTLTIVHVESGEIVDSVQCYGKARAREVYLKATYRGVEFGGKKFFKTPLGKATAGAMQKGLCGIVKKVPVRMWEPMIAAVVDDTIILNGGVKRGFKEGQIYTARISGKKVTDPVTGDVLDVIEGLRVGSFRIVKVEEKIAYATVIDGKGFERGQRVVRKK